jgi:SAM-dependent methyltransferase
LLATAREVIYLAAVNNQIDHLELGRPARPGQLILERRFQIARRAIGGFNRDEILLDLGCGNGAQTVLFAASVKRVIGVDIISIKGAEQAVAPESFSFVRSDAGYLSLRDNFCDIATSFEVLEHVPDDGLAISEVARVLRPGGKFIFSLPNKWWIFESHGAHVQSLNWVPWNRVPFVSWLPSFIHTRIAKARIYTLKGALKLAQNAGLKPIAWGYITAPLDVLPEGALRRLLRATIFRKETTKVPFLAVNLYVCCRKPKTLLKMDDGI